MHVFLMIFWLANGDIQHEVVPMKSEEACWEAIEKTDFRRLPEQATFTCISLHDPKAI